MTEILNNTNKNNFKLSLKWALLPFIVILTFAIMIVAIWGFNFHIDLAGGWVITAEIGDDLNDKEIYNKYTEIVCEVAKDNNIKISSIQKQGQNDALSLVVKYKDISDKTTQQMAAITESIKTEMLTKFNAENGAVLYKIEGERIAPAKLNNLILVSSLTAFGMLALAFLYLWIRFELFSAIAIIKTMFLDALILGSAVAIFRIPFSFITLGIFAFVMIYSLYNNTIIFENIRNQKRKDAANELSFSYIASGAARKSVKRLAFMAGTLILPLIMLLCFNLSLFAVVLTAVLGILISSYSTLYIIAPLFAKFADKNGNVKYKTLKEKLKMQINN